MKARVILCIVVCSLCCLSCAKSGTAGYWPTDQWKLTAPEEVGMDRQTLEPLLSARGRLPGITSVLAVRHGLIAFEKYYVGDAATLRSAHSVAKSVISCLVGVAIKQGLIEGVDQKMIDFFPENEMLTSDPRVREVSLRHLLTMSDGIRASGNTVQYYFTDPKLFRPLQADPGARFEDNFMSAQIVSMILTRASGESAHDFARQHVFQPLGITESLWLDFMGQSGVSHGSDGLLLTSRDMAKIGYLFLKGGTWEDEQLLPEQWVAQCTSEQIETGQTAGHFGSYGYFWWVRAFGAHPGYFAVGTGGQVICVVPGLDLVAVTTSKADTMQSEEGRYLELIEEHVIGSIRD